ncbi:MAG: NADH-ubiquinone oxidoreductase chain J [Candidatus Kapaibacterium sp.]|jgi:NADH-quinone oxidoreductase subunit J|nr:MAG: NADH-ubiquinone oxidoreductase chain J [Candidatus Kapabacteria bacterium]ROL56549.1 MAG: NADH-quinone oxidoreductase subunit J [Bacteroidetes/Chlorobi group bacterium Naka2016]
MLVDIAFWFFAVLIIGSALVVVLSRNMIYAVFALLFTFFGVAGIYVLLNADFLAVTQIMIYIGGILVLLIFGIMLTSNVTGVDIKSGQTGKIQMFFAGLISLFSIIFLVYIATTTNWKVSNGSDQSIMTTIDSIGKELLTNYLLAFESASVLLLIAIIGAALIARRK